MGEQQMMRDQLGDPKILQRAPKRRGRRIILLLSIGALAVAGAAAGKPYVEKNPAYQRLVSTAQAQMAPLSAQIGKFWDRYVPEGDLFAALRTEVSQTSARLGRNPANLPQEDKASGAADQAEIDSEREPALDVEHPASRLADRSPASLAERPHPLPAVSNPRALGVGDSLKVVIYERVATEDDKWGRPTSALTGIQQRPELSGDYIVQEDGNIAVPLLGVVPAAGRSESEVQSALSGAFEDMLGRRPLVNVMLSARAPIYVLGPVRAPGSFKYVPGMTVLHAIALAGGLDPRISDPWQNIEAIRATETREEMSGSMLKMLARAAVLRAERDVTTPVAPPQLVAMAGAAQADNLINEQIDRRRAIVLAQEFRKQTAMNAIEAATHDVRIYARMDSLEDLVKIRRERMDNIRSLVQRKVLDSDALSQAQAELADAEERRHEAFNQYLSAKQRLATLQAETLKAQSEIASELAGEVEETQRQIVESQRELDTSDEILSALPGTRSPSTSTGKRQTIYRVVRQTDGRPVEIQASGMTVLEPGDLVNIAEDASQPLHAPTPEPSGQITGTPLASVNTQTVTSN
ncbi:hypothetical protein GTW51_08765 [Aurantimonas aggregata]|uniref:Uncharacterized protein n=1 Tax=Aurantimonas aggregata TaxID=2047720 RepID=A0A6L9MG71_9HYPH|nr:polysaccharide biosynthesis/export family protein [Aurantimonas aggregata]NDV86793.1 hypothetical protein [Aurantimonas aggregata]